MILPSDNYILLSLINTKLRDGCPSLSELCGQEDIAEEELCDRLSAIGYAYSPSENAFKKV